MSPNTSDEQHGRNALRLANPLTDRPGHFSLWEFENTDGLAMVHSSVIRSLELLRESLAYATHKKVAIVIKDAVRTPDDLKRLAAQHRWMDQGGLVSRTSRHLVEHGGIAVDIVAVFQGPRTSPRTPLAPSLVGEQARKFFDFVKDDYADGHVHCDNRRQPIRPPLDA